MIDYKDLKMKCTKADPQEPFFTEGKEYDIIKNACGYGIMDNDGEVPDYGPNLFELENNLNEFWDSKFELVNIDEPEENKVLLILDENKDLTINIKKEDEGEVIYMLMAGLIHVCKEVELEQDLMIETIKELWGRVE